MLDAKKKEFALAHAVAATSENGLPFGLDSDSVI